MEENSANPGTALDMPGAMPGQGCDIDGEFFMDGMQVHLHTYIFTTQYRKGLFMVKEG